LYALNIFENSLVEFVREIRSSNGCIEGQCKCMRGINCSWLYSVKC